MSAAPTPPSPKPRRTRLQRFLLTVNILAVFAALATAASLAYLNRQVDQIQRVSLGRGVLVTDVPAGRPQNYLIVGADSAAGLSDEDAETHGRQIGAEVRSDTIIILRVEPGQTKAKLLSLPRDLWVPIAGTGGEQRINAAIQSGGPDALVRTIENYLKVPINHFVQVDFLGFKELVEAIDGVPVYFPEPVRDKNSGLNIPEAGCHVLDPDSALAFVRSRHYQEYRDGRWVSEPGADLRRIKRQQFFIQRALTTAIDRGVRDPGTLKRLIEVGVQSVVLDDELTVLGIIDLGQQFKNFSPDNLETYTVPVEEAVRGRAAVLEMRVSEAQPVLDRFRGVDATETAKSTTTSAIGDRTTGDSNGTSMPAAPETSGPSTTRVDDFLPDEPAPDNACA